MLEILISIHHHYQQTLFFYKLNHDRNVKKLHLTYFLYILNLVVDLKLINTTCPYALELTIIIASPTNCPLFFAHSYKLQK